MRGAGPLPDDSEQQTTGFAGKSRLRPIVGGRRRRALARHGGRSGV